MGVRLEFTFFKMSFLLALIFWTLKMLSLTPMQLVRHGGGTEGQHMLTGGGVSVQGVGLGGSL